MISGYLLVARRNVFCASRMRWISLGTSKYALRISRSSSWISPSMRELSSFAAAASASAVWDITPAPARAAASSSRLHAFMAPPLDKGDRHHTSRITPRRDLKPSAGSRDEPSDRRPGTCVAAQSGMLANLHSQSGPFLGHALSAAVARLTAPACRQGD